jgi:hypothetical protein
MILYGCVCAYVLRVGNSTHWFRSLCARGRKTFPISPPCCSAIVISELQRERARQNTGNRCSAITSLSLSVQMRFPLGALQISCFLPQERATLLKETLSLSRPHLVGRNEIAGREGGKSSLFLCVTHIT